MKITEADLKKELAEMKQASAEVRAYLETVDKKIAELDLRYAKLLVRDEITALKTAKAILLGRNK
jgi:hypothetical protein